MLATVLGIALFGGCARASTPCERLKDISLPHATVVGAAEVVAGSVKVCKVEVESHPTSDSDIRIEVWLPASAAWNGRYVQLGNGGLAGSINSAPLQALASAGYAAAGTDDGHQASPFDGRWALGHPEKVIDYGWRALKETTDAAKPLIISLEGASARYAYFDGCSDGGREALMEAERFPDDFDGIIAGAPAADVTGLIAMFAFSVQQLAAPGAWLGPNALNLLESSALAQCAQGAKYIADPQACRFDAMQLVCRPGGDAAHCLTAGQAAAANAIHHGVIAPDGTIVSPGYTVGGEAEPYPFGETGPPAANWSTWLAGPSQNKSASALAYLFASSYGALLQDASYDILKFDPTSTTEAIKALGRELNSNNADLGRFEKRGGKLIQFHGWNDAAIPAQASLAFFDDLRRKTPNSDQFYRLYMVPGMLHCFGGPGPQGVDWLGLVQAWVEKGEPPGLVVARPSGQGAAGVPPPIRPGDPTQPLCPYPARAADDGKSCLTEAAR